MAGCGAGERERNEERKHLFCHADRNIRNYFLVYGKSVSHGLMATEKVTSVPWFQLDVIG